MTKTDPLTDVLAQIPAVAMFAKYVDAARTTGTFAKRMDALEITVTVDTAALAASVAEHWDTAAIMPQGVIEGVKQVIQFQVDSTPPWTPVKVVVPESVTIPSADEVA